MKVVAVHGNKGGVGKSMVAKNLAHQLALRGLKVGLLDADIDSPYVVEMLGVTEKVTLDKDRRMVPSVFDGMRIMSFALWVQGTYEGATMHGDFHSAWIRDALVHTDWGDTEVIVADLPAGSGDEFLTVRKTLGDSLVGIVAVAEPHIVSGLARVYNAAVYHKLRILGVIENKSGEVFGSGRVEAFCKEKGLRFYGSIPLDARIPLAHERGELWLPLSVEGAVCNAASDIEGKVRFK